MEGDSATGLHCSVYTQKLRGGPEWLGRSFRLRFHRYPRDPRLPAVVPIGECASFRAWQCSNCSFPQNVSATEAFISGITVTHGLHGRNILNKNQRWYITTLESWRTHLVVQSKMCLRQPKITVRFRSQIRLRHFVIYLYDTFISNDIFLVQLPMKVQRRWLPKCLNFCVLWLQHQ